MSIKTIDPTGINPDLREHLKETGAKVIVVEKMGDIMKVLGRLYWTGEEFVLDEDYLKGEPVKACAEKGLE